MVKHAMIAVTLLTLGTVSLREVQPEAAAFVAVSAGQRLDSPARVGLPS